MFISLLSLFFLPNSLKKYADFLSSWGELSLTIIVPNYYCYILGFMIVKDCSCDLYTILLAGYPLSVPLTKFPSMLPLAANRFVHEKFALDLLTTRYSPLLRFYLLNYLHGYLLSLLSSTREDVRAVDLFNAVEYDDLSVSLMYCLIWLKELSESFFLPFWRRETHIFLYFK